MLLTNPNPAATLQGRDVTRNPSSLGPMSGFQEHMGLSRITGTLFWGPYNKDPTI